MNAMKMEDSLLREKLLEVLGKEPARVLSFTLTRGCLRREVFRGQLEVVQSIEMVSQRVKEGEEELDWIRFQKVDALKKAERMADLERDRSVQLEENKLRLEELKTKLERVKGFVAERGGYSGVDMLYKCSCEELCLCLKSLEAVFTTPEGGERRAVLDSDSIIGEWGVKNADTEDSADRGEHQVVVATGGVEAVDTVGGEEVEAVITAEDVVTVDPAEGTPEKDLSTVGTIEGGAAAGTFVVESSDWSVSEIGTHRGEGEDEVKIKIPEAIFPSQDVREKNMRLKEAQAEVDRLRCEADDAMSVEAREVMQSVAERQVVNVVHNMERLVGEKRYEDVIAEEAKLWKVCGDLLRAMGTGARLKDHIYVWKFQGRLLYGQAAVMLGRLDLLEKVVGSKESPLRQLPALGVRGLDEHMMARWFVLRGLLRVEHGKFIEGNWDFGRAQDVANKSKRNMGRLGKRVAKECVLLREWLGRKKAQKEGAIGVVEFPPLQW